MIRYFLGEDTYAARQEIEALVKKESASLRWIDKDETDSMSPSQWLPQGNGSLFGVQITILRDVSRWPKQTQMVLEDAFKKKLISNCIVWDRVNPDKRLSLYKVLKPHAKEFSHLSQRELVSWLMEEAKKRDGVIDERAAGLMIAKLGFDRWQLASELEKMLLTHDTVTREVVEESITTTNVQAEIFAMLDALSAGNSARAVTIMDDLLSEGEPELKILATVATQFKSLILVQEGLSRGKNKDEIAKAAGLHPYVVQKSLSVVRRHTREYLLDALTRAMATDFAMKQGKVDMRTGLIMFILSLAK